MKDENKKEDKKGVTVSSGLSPPSSFILHPSSFILFLDRVVLVQGVRLAFRRRLRLVIRRTFLADRVLIVRVPASATRCATAATITSAPNTSGGSTVAFGGSRYARDR